MTTTTEVAAPDLSGAALARITATLAATAAHYDATADFPWEPIRAVHAAGLLTLGIAPRYGGQELRLTELARVLRWPEELYQRVVAESVTRPVLMNAVRAEPEWGAPARGGLPDTKVRKTAAGWVLNGHKAYGTGAEGLSYHLVWAATQDPEPLVGHVIVPGDHPGIEVVRTWDHLGMRATSTHDIIYRDVDVPAENFPGVTVEQAARDASGLSGAGIGLLALYVGVARAAQEFFVAFAGERVPTSLGRPIATTERIQAVAGEIEAQLVQAEEVLYSLAAKIDAGDPDALVRAAVGRRVLAAHITS